MIVPNSSNRISAGLGAIFVALLSTSAIAQSIASDNKPRPGSPTTGWSGNFSPPGRESKHGAPKPWSVGLNALELSADGKVLYFSAFTGRRLYSVGADDLVDPTLNSERVNGEISSSAWRRACLRLHGLDRAHEIVMPWAGLTPPTWDLPANEQGAELIGHVLWGLVIGVFYETFRRRWANNNEPHWIANAPLEIPGAFRKSGAGIVHPRPVEVA